MRHLFHLETTLASYSLKRLCKKILNACICHLVVSVEDQADGAIGVLLAHALVVLSLCLKVIWSTLPQLGKRLCPLLFLFLVALQIYIRIYR